MKQFLVKLSVIFIIIVGITLFLNYHYLKSKHVYAYHIIQHFISIPSGLDLVNLGSSHGAAFRFDQYPEIRSWNFSMQAQIFHYDYAVIRKYTHTLNKNATVIIPVSLFSFLNNPDHRNDIKPRYYLTINFEDVIKGNYFDYLLIHTLPLLTVKDNWLNLLFPKKNSLGESVFEPENAGIKAAATRKGWDAIKTGIPDTELIQLNSEYLNAIIQYCLDSGFRPVLVTTPMHISMKLAYSDSEIDDFRDIVSGILSAYPEIVYLDYSFDDRFSTNHLLFSDNNHLNENGAFFFTSVLRDDLIHNGLYPIPADTNQ